MTIEIKDLPDGITSWSAAKLQAYQGIIFSYPDGWFRYSHDARVELGRLQMIAEEREYKGRLETHRQSVAAEERQRLEMYGMTL